jgi:hypothetical protein
MRISRFSVSAALLSGAFCLAAGPASAQAPQSLGTFQSWSGYKYKDGAQTDVQIGSQKFAFFTKNDSDDGSAWVKDVSDEARLVEAMKVGVDATVTGVSARGTTTKDTYSMAGLSEALEKVHSACGM